MKAMRTIKTLSLKAVMLFTAFTIKQTANGQQANVEQKDCFYKAKATIDSMLSGKLQPDFEKAIFVTENAYWNNKINYSAFDEAIAFQAKRIGQMVSAMKKIDAATKFKIYPTETKEGKIAGHENLQKNWGIFTFMTDTTSFFYHDTMEFHLPYLYSRKDPYGTVDWANTQVTGLLVNQTGNCYAMACLYKLLADKLNTGANIATAPGHAFIQHTDDDGITYNMELASHSFQGSGAIESFTYTTNKAMESGIAMRALTDKQDIGMCLVYLAKGYESRLGAKDADFILNCAETALQYDSLNLNAMLLKAEVLESRVLAENKTIVQLQNNSTFLAYQTLIKQIYSLGYREMPIEMQNTILAKLNNDDYPAIASNTPQSFQSKKLNNQSVASASGGMFDEEIKDKAIEKYHRTLFNTKTNTIIAFDKVTVTYDNYTTDPVVAAMSVDPLTEHYSMLSPYQFASNTPIEAIDVDGLEALIIVGACDNGDGTSQIRIISDNTVANNMSVPLQVTVPGVQVQTANGVINPQTVVYNGSTGIPAIDAALPNLRVAPTQGNGQGTGVGGYNVVAGGNPNNPNDPNPPTPLMILSKHPATEAPSANPLSPSTGYQMEFNMSITIPNAALNAAQQIPINSNEQNTPMVQNTQNFQATYNVPGNAINPTLNVNNVNQFNDPDVFMVTYMDPTGQIQNAIIPNGGNFMNIPIMAGSTVTFNITNQRANAQDLFSITGVVNYQVPVQLPVPANCQ